MAESLKPWLDPSNLLAAIAMSIDGEDLSMSWIVHYVAAEEDSDRLK